MMRPDELRKLEDESNELKVVREKEEFEKEKKRMKELKKAEERRWSQDCGRKEYRGGGD